MRFLSPWGIFLEFGQGGVEGKEEMNEDLKSGRGNLLLFQRYMFLLCEPGGSLGHRSSTLVGVNVALVQLESGHQDHANSPNWGERRSSRDPTRSRDGPRSLHIHGSAR